MIHDYSRSVLLKGVEEHACQQVYLCILYVRVTNTQTNMLNDGERRDDVQDRMLDPVSQD